MDEQKQMRIQNFEHQKLELEKQGYVAKEGTISVLMANVMALVTALPIAILLVVLYMMIWKEGVIIGSLSSVLLFWGAVIASIFVHEFLHGFTWHLFCKEKWKSIHFGFMVKVLTPYCHCKEPLSFKQYLLGGLMPFLVLGIGAGILGILIQSVGVTAFAAFNILAAGGDTTVACMLLKHRNALIMDHPTDCGFIAFTKK